MLPDNNILDIIISLVLIYALLSILVSILTEWVNKWQKTRAAFLKKSIFQMLDDPLNVNFGELFDNHYAAKDYPIKMRRIKFKDEEKCEGSAISLSHLSNVIYFFKSKLSRSRSLVPVGNLLLVSRQPFCLKTNLSRPYGWQHPNIYNTQLKPSLWLEFVDIQSLLFRLYPLSD